MWREQLNLYRAGGLQAAEGPLLPGLSLVAEAPGLVCNWIRDLCVALGGEGGCCTVV